MSKRKKVAAALYVGVAPTLTWPHEAHAAEIAPVYAAPAKEADIRPVINQQIQISLGRLVLPSINDPKLPLRPRGDFSTDPGLLDVVVAHKTAGQKIMYSAEELAYFRELKRLDDISRLASAIDKPIEGVSPQLSQQGVTHLLKHGFPINGTSAIWGAVIKESKGRTNAVSPDGFRGLYQWSSTRYARVGARADDLLEVQLDRGIWEMKNFYPGAYEILMNPETSLQAANDAMHLFEGEANIYDGRRIFAAQLQAPLMAEYLNNPPTFYVQGRMPETVAA